MLSKALRNGQGSDNINHRINIRSDGDGLSNSINNNNRRTGERGGIVIIPQERDDYTLYTEIDDVQPLEDQYYNDDEFHA